MERRPVIALLTDRRYVEAPTGSRPVDPYVANIFTEDRLLIEALKRREIDARRVDWADAATSWDAFDLAVFRTTWDYFDRFEEFGLWLAETATEVRLVNSAKLVRWNWDKHYLRDLERAGVPVVETVFVEAGSSASLSAVLAERGWDEGVIKPAISGAARHTYRIPAEVPTELQARFDALVADEAMLVQPFMHDVVEQGEVTVMVIGGKVTHGVLKKPKAGDFRVQDDHGGTVHAHVVTAEQAAIAEAALAACPSKPAYGRVDLVRDESGALRVMELEIIEPELWLRLHPPAAEALADVLAARL